MDTVAIPQIVHLRPIQVTPVPVKVNVAVAPAMSELPAEPPLKAATSAPRRTHAPAGLALTAGLSSSIRVTAPPLKTVTVTPAEVVRLPAASRAIVVSVCEPLLAVAVFQETPKGAAVSSAPSAAPSSKNCTPATPTLSEAFAVTGIVPETVAPLAGELMLTVGGVVSGGGPFETLTVTGAEVGWVAHTSGVQAPMVCERWLAVAVLTDTESAAVVSPAAIGASPYTTRFRSTPTLSEAFAVTGIVPETVAPLAGELMLTVGGVVSGGGPFETLTVTGAEV